MRMSIRTTSGRRAGSSSTASSAVGALGNDLEPVGRGEDPRQAGPDDGLVVDEGDPDHGVPLVLSRSCVLRLQRKPAAHPPALGRRPGRELAAERGRPLPHPDQAVPGSLRLAGRCGDRRAGRLGDEARPPVGHLEPENGPRVRRVLRRVRERLLGDPVERDSDARRDRRRGPLASAARPRDPRPAHRRRARGSPSPTEAAAPPPPRRRCGAARPYGAAPACCAGPPPRPTAAPPRRPRGRGAARAGRW